MTDWISIVFVVIASAWLIPGIFFALCTAAQDGFWYTVKNLHAIMFAWPMAFLPERSESE